MADRIIRWAWLLLAVIALLGYARATRYRMVGDYQVWDRWQNRICIVKRGECWDVNGSRSFGGRPVGPATGSPFDNVPIIPGNK